MPRKAAEPRPATLHLDIPSDFARMRDVQKQVMNLVETMGFDEESVFAIRLSLEEGLINAIKHGNKLDPAKTVHVDATVDPNTFEIVIRDEGKGFKRDDVPDPLAEENLDKSSGRGILLIESYMNEVEYTDRGRTLRMVRRNQK
jgi:serine/threonine-protein kinase RsbW